MDEADVISKLEALGKKLPHFSDGRINYTNTDYAPVICVFIRFDNQILLLKRSGKVSNYKGKWNAITGFIDKPEPLKEKALGEVEEETGITKELIKEVILGTPYELPDDEINKTWLVCPFVIELNSRPKIKLDFESTEYKWIKPEQLNAPDTVRDLGKSYAACLKT